VRPTLKNQSLSAKKRDNYNTKRYSQTSGFISFQFGNKSFSLTMKDTCHLPKSEHKDGLLFVLIISVTKSHSGSWMKQSITNPRAKVIGTRRSQSKPIAVNILDPYLNNKITRTALKMDIWRYHKNNLIVERYDFSLQTLATSDLHQFVFAITKYTNNKRPTRTLLFKEHGQDTFL
jgi:hypothetical protein